MLYLVLVPKEPTDAIPRGAAILEHGRGSALVLANVNEPFGERCAQAARHGRLMPVPDGCIAVGHYESTDGELRLQHGGAHALARWLGHPVSRGDLEARDNRTTRRHRARQLFYQGRYAEAQRIDPRMGL
jgi:hypothetical protein